MRKLRLVALSLLAVGCVDFGDKDARVPGEELGAYQVTAHLQESTCGPDALGSADCWDFSVRLSREGPGLFWLNGYEVISGEVADDGVSFRFDTMVAVEIDPAQGTHPGCTVHRTDSANGKLSSATMDVESFTGQLSYAYAAEQESDCTELVGVPGGFSALPCEMSYAIEGLRTELPEERE